MRFLPPTREETNRLRDVQRARNVLPYETIGTAEAKATPTLRQEADALIEKGWSLGGFRIPALTKPTNWNHENRSFRFHIQAWDLLDTLLIAHSCLGDNKYFKTALNIALDWVSKFQRPALERDLEEVIEHKPKAYEDFVWYDMGVGQRSYRLAYVVDVAGKCTGVDANTYHQLVTSLLFHCELLSHPDFFRAHNNHGFYQALGFAASARRLGHLAEVRNWPEISARQVATTVKSQFFGDGFHREHSPAYHLIVLRTLLNARNANLLTSDVSQLVGRGREALGWMTQPDGKIANFGDSDTVSARLKPGDLCTGVHSSPEAGYAFTRRMSSDSGATYLAQQSAFHSRVHKHADHLSFIWFDRDRPILIDAGRFGYAGRTAKGDGLWEQGFWYGDPRRVYVESTSAHNCVEVDGQSYRRRPKDVFGSALAQAERQGDLSVFYSQAQYQYLRLTQRRLLILQPGAFLVCLDFMLGRSEHSFRQWFQLDPRWDARLRNGAIEAVDGEQTLQAVDLLQSDRISECIRGQDEPLQGWRSLRPNVLEPSNSFHVHQLGRNAAFATLFSLEGKPVALNSRTNVTGSGGRLAWEVNGSRRLLDFKKEHDRYRVSFSGT